jgi:hypothetical protein
MCEDSRFGAQVVDLHALKQGAFMPFKTVLAASITAAIFAGLTIAQNPNSNPVFGSISLYSDSSFSRVDPVTIAITAGGSIDATTTINPFCRGMINNAPDFRMEYTAGSSPLSIGVRSDGDTTLIVNTPSGHWHCNDDGGEGLNPLMTFSSPESGQYDIWVGTYGIGDEFLESTLTFSQRGE